MYFFFYGGKAYTHSPHLPVLLGRDGDLFIEGDLLKNILGISDEQADALHVEGLKNKVRFERNRLLAETDWVVSRSIETGEPIPHEWAAYRQALRDLPESVDGVTDAVFPQKPE